MYLIRIGKKIINLEYLILAEEWDATDDAAQALKPGDVRVTLESGRVLNLRGDDGKSFLRHVEDVIPSPDVSSGGGAAAVIGRPLDPKTGQPLERGRGVDRKTGG